MSGTSVNTMHPTNNLVTTAAASTSNITLVSASNSSTLKNLSITQSAGETYEASIQYIQNTFGLPLGSDPDAIINKFLELENANFSLFNYINTVNAEIEHFEHSIDEMRKKIDQHRGLGFNDHEQKRLRHRAIIDKLYKVKLKINEYEDTYKASLHTIDTLKLGIHNILARVGSSVNNALSDADPLVANFNGSDTVEVSDILTYIGLIEQRTNEILLAYATSQQQLQSNVKAANTDQNPVHTLQLPYLSPSGGLPVNSHTDMVFSSVLKGTPPMRQSVGATDGGKTSFKEDRGKRVSNLTNKLKSSIPEILNRTYGINMGGGTSNLKYVLCGVLSIY